MSRPISRLSSRTVTIANSAEVFEVIREAQSSPAQSSINMNATSTFATGSTIATGSAIATASATATVSRTDSKLEKTEENEKATPFFICSCKAIKDAEQEKKHAEEIEKLLKNKEVEMEDKFQDRMAQERQYLKKKFEFIIQNEQIRAAHMLREAHRERQEKISALQTQLECKNMAGLMYVLCAERRKSRMKIKCLTEEYTNYIHGLQQILEESESLVQKLSRGYKTVARVDHEWREKMKKIIKHFQSFVNNFTGGEPETNQYLLDLPELLKTKQTFDENPEESSCEAEEAFNENDSAPVVESGGAWWQRLDGDNRPFVMFGDMADFEPAKRGAALRSVKAEKTAPKKWKEYVFNDMYVKANCPNIGIIQENWKRFPPPLERWECTAHTDRPSSAGSETSRRVTTASVDVRGHMGSILKIITSQSIPPLTPKSTLLGARDSMEIASTTRLREKRTRTSEHRKVSVNIGDRIESMFDEMYEELEEEQEEVQSETEFGNLTSNDVDEEDNSQSALGSVHKDSLQVISHIPEEDHKINYEKICPMEKCQKLQTGSFMRSLPPYMNASPYMHFEQTYEDYETCTPEQLEILKQRIEEKKKKERVMYDVIDDPLVSWTPSVDGIAVQTSCDEMSLPPCTCLISGTNTSEMSQRVYKVADLVHVKQKLDTINADYFFSEDIEFNRFQLVGQKDDIVKDDDEKNFNQARLHEIKIILKKHPSLCELFQGNIRC